MGGARPAYEVDARRWPFVSARATPAVNDEHDALSASYLAFDELLARRQSFVFLFDMRGGVSTPTRRRRLQSWVTHNRTAISLHVRAAAIVVGSALERGFVTAATWLISSPCPLRVFSDEAEAESWLRSAL